VACLALPYFSTLSHTGTLKKNLLNIKCVLISSTNVVWNISHFNRN